MSGLYDALSKLAFWLWGLTRVAPVPLIWGLSCLLVGILILTLVVWYWGPDPLLWRLFRLLGWIRRLLQVRWVLPLAGFVVMFLVVRYLFGSMIERWLDVPKNSFNLWTILAAYTLIWLLVWAWQARQRLVVEEFKNYVGDDLNASVKGLAMLLVVRLSQFHDLYRTVDEQRAIPTSALQSEAIDAAINVEDTGTVLKDAVSSQSTLSLGPLSIPVTLCTLLRWLKHTACKGNMPTLPSC